ncbi:MAG: hypothetical protein Q8O89_02890 [Nanoarchaeota archaeon]|nr:hypothetical protein [Nanoarchaeota archaeon]
MKDAEKKRIEKNIINTYVPLRKLIFEENNKNADIINDFKDYSHVLASVELVIYCFVTANLKIKDGDVLSSLKRVKKDPLYEFSDINEDDAFEFAITYGISRGLQQKRLAINEVCALLDWMIHEVEGRLETDESYVAWIKKFFNDNKREGKNGVEN